MKKYVGQFGLVPLLNNLAIGVGMTFLYANPCNLCINVEINL